MEKEDIKISSFLDDIIKRPQGLLATGILIQLISIFSKGAGYKISSFLCTMTLISRNKSGKQFYSNSFREKTWNEFNRGNEIPVQ